MQKPLPLCDCKSKLDAYFLKNVLQRVTCISIDIIRNKDKMILIVEESNLKKANVVLINQLPILPSTLYKKTISKKEVPVIRMKVDRKYISVTNHHRTPVVNLFSSIKNRTFSI